MVVEPKATEDDGLQVAAATGKFLQEYEPTTWLLEEYKLLSAHYFHEDNYYQQSLATFSTLNGALIAFYASDLASKTSAAHFSIPTIGIVLTIAWAVSMVRIRELRRYAQDRMAKIESALHELWRSSDLPIRPLDIGTRELWETVGQTGAWGKFRLGWIRNVPASNVALILPLTFNVIWIVLLII